MSNLYFLLDLKKKCPTHPEDENRTFPIRICEVDVSRKEIKCENVRFKRPIHEKV